MPSGLTIVGEHDQGTVDQLARCVAAEEGAVGALMPDGHLGYSMPIGGVVAYRNLVSPSGVGYDIGCGNKAVLTDLQYNDVLAADLPGIMDEIVRRVSFGMGRANDEPADHPVLEEIERAAFEPQRELAGLARKQLGTVGAGNHYVDLFRDEDDLVWVGVHFGSRGFGHKTASGFLSLAAGGGFDGRGGEGGMDAPPTVFPADSELGQSYVEAMGLAGRYAYAGRDVVCDKVLEILGAEALDEVHNHHNFAWREEHGGEQFWVVRKGATPAFPGQRGFVGSTMGEPSVILEGADAPDLQAGRLYSTVHGAGRAMSRTRAAGKVKRRKVWECGDRDCSRTFEAARNEHPPKGACPDHPDARALKRWRREVVRPGEIDFDEVRRDLAARGVELRGGAADEAPGAYKRLDRVLEAAGPTVRVLETLTPLGVAMAGPDVRDPYRD